MIRAVPPAMIFILGAMLIPLLKGKLKQFYLLLVPALAFLDVIHLNQGTSWVYRFLGYDLIFCEVDRSHNAYNWRLLSFGGYYYPYC